VQRLCRRASRKLAPPSARMRFGLSRKLRLTRQSPTVTGQSGQLTKSLAFSQRKGPGAAGLITTFPVFSRQRPLIHFFTRSLAPTPFAHNNAPAAHNSYVKAQKAPSVPSAQIRRPVHSALPTQEFESKIGKNKGAKKAIRRRIALSFFRSCGYVIESKRLICRATLLFR
jgi:hypothetical protein